MEDANAYKLQLQQIDIALSASISDSEKEELLGLKQSIIELLSLTNNDAKETEPASNSNNHLDDEFALFMSEMEKDGVVQPNTESSSSQNLKNKIDLTSVEGMKCRAPHKHQWGNTAYHNAMVCGIVSSDLSNAESIEVRVLFMNPTHKEMIPCPYYFENECKFSEEACHYSHGEVVLLSSLQDYSEPNFEKLSIGSRVLAKQHNLWHRARVKNLYNEKCLVKFESNQKSVELSFDHLFPLENDGSDDSDSDSSKEENSDYENDVINMSLMITPSNQAIGDWEQYTKGIGSKLMQKMGYIIGTGLGRKCDGRIDPVTAVILPAGKSLDHCMNLREKSGGDKDLFSVDRKMKRLQKRQEAQSRKVYEKEKNKVDVFNFINSTLSSGSSDKTLTGSSHRQEIKKETSRNLNVASLQTDESIKRVEQDLYKIRESLSRHKDKTSTVHKQLKDKLIIKESELKILQSQALNIKNEQSVRNDKRKLTIF